MKFYVDAYYYKRLYLKINWNLDRIALKPRTTNYIFNLFQNKVIDKIFLDTNKELRRCVMNFFPFF